MGAKLRIVPANADAYELVIQNTATIGRTRENTVCFNLSPLVSRQHALIRCHDGYHYQLVDLGSRNGTFVNDQRVVLPVTLNHGDVIRIANNELGFEQMVEEVHDESMAATIDGGEQDAEEIQPVALMVCDIRGFSTMSEKIPGSSLAQVLGVWFREAGNLIQKSGGVIDKFIGDALLAYWPLGAGKSTQSLGGNMDMESMECVAAFDSAQKLSEIAATIKWPETDAPFRIAIALHFGKVTCGNIGLDAQRDATIIGDAVNTVFRMEGLTKQLNQTIILSEDIVAMLPKETNFMDLGEHTLKGKRKPVRVFGTAT